MSVRALVVALVVLATAGFVVGVTIERHTKETPGVTHHEESGQEGEHAEKPVSENHGEFRPFGVDVEAVPFIVLAALASLAMAAAVWTRPESLLVLGIVGVAMLLFAVLDVREVFHQVDENRTGLAVLAGAVAALHLAAAGGVAVLAGRDGEPARQPIGST